MGRTMSAPEIRDKVLECACRPRYRYRKEFLAAEYLECNGPAIEAVRRYLLRHGRLVMAQEEETFRGDLYAWNLRLRTVELHEVEMRLRWTGLWPRRWKTIHVPERKERYFSMDRAVFFWSVSRWLDVAWCLPQEVVAAAPKIHVPNRKCPTGEERLFDVPVHQALWIRFREEDACI